ncbi:cyclophilin-like fold protein [Kineococcus sp. GCM10028916]
MTGPRVLLIAVVLLTGVAVTSCSSSPTAAPAGDPVTGPPSSSADSSAGEADTATLPATTDVVGTVVRFTSPRTSVDVTIGEDSPATRDFLSMLPLTLPVEDLAGREKISYLPRELDHAGSPGSDPEDGDLIYFTPWGNLGFYYDASGIEYADDTLHLGTYQASAEQLELLEGGAVSVDVVP